jgi:asparagine synthase (glutamine-hydrolysing)
MCGIFGWIARRDRSFNEKTLVQLTDLMSHRGPDGSGYWLGHTRGGDYQIGFGHRRLSIIDIAGGAQPMHSVDRRFIIVFNGELYNYVELRDELIERGHIFKSLSDTEVLIEAYRAWGLDCLKHFRGMFSFTLWDTKEERLVIARDPFGKKPIFIAEPSGTLLVSSEIEPLVSFPNMDRALNVQALEQYLLNRYVPGPATFFQSVRKLQPGCYLIWSEGKYEIARYFTPPFATTEPDVTDFDEAVSMFTQAFDDAVRIRMRSDAPFGAYLSGGIDSSAVVAAMTRHSSGRIRTFSVGFQEADYSELDHARCIARRFETDHSELVVGHKEFLEHWPMAVLRRGAPVSEASDIPILLLSRAASAAVKMVLTGEGADELIGGYPKHRAEPWIEIYQRLVPKRVHDNLVTPAVRALPYSLRRVKIFVRAAGERDLLSRMRLWFAGISVNERNVLLGRVATRRPVDDYPFSAPIGSSFRRTLFFDQTSWLPDNLLERGDRMMMAGSIEGRMPFMDTILASVVARFPDKYLIGARGGKLVLRAAMAKVLEPATLYRKKIGFRVPFDQWLRGAYRELVRDLLLSELSQISWICDRSAVHRFVKEHLDGRQNHEKVLWSLMNLEIFLRSFKVSGLDSARVEAGGLNEDFRGAWVEWSTPMGRQPL